MLENAPTRLRTRSRACLECRRQFKPTRMWHRYCSDACRAKDWNAHQRSLFPLVPVSRFDGETVEPEDVSRLAHQLDLVRWLMGDGAWRTLSQIGTEIGAPEASVSARLRDLRKARFGGHKVERKRLSGGLHQYRVAS